MLSPIIPKVVDNWNDGTVVTLVENIENLKEAKYAIY